MLRKVSVLYGRQQRSILLTLRNLHFIKLVHDAFAEVLPQGGTPLYINILNLIEQHSDLYTTT